MEIILILIVIIILLGVSQYLTFKHTKKLKLDLRIEKQRTGEYKIILENTENLSKQSKDIDKKIEEKKVERKKLSKKDKISAANNRG